MVEFPALVNLFDVQLRPPNAHNSFVIRRKSKTEIVHKQALFSGDRCGGGQLLLLLLFAPVENNYFCFFEKIFVIFAE